METHRLQAVPFLPIIFNPALGDLGNLLAPPYDVIDAQQCQSLLARHPYNVVRLILPPSLNENDPNRYAEAAALWQQWLKEESLVQLEEPSVFVYAQHFHLYGQPKTHLALLTTIPLTPYESGLVRPHEHTLPKPKSDRLTLLRTMGAELGQVHGLLSDERGEWHQLLQEATQQPVWLQGSLDGVTHRLWRITDPAFVEEVNRVVADQWLVIADGHHRYETALVFREEVADAKTNANHPVNLIGIVLSDYQQNATILPTHRLLRFTNPEQVEHFLRGLQRRFWLTEVQWDGSDQQLMSLLSDAEGIPFLVVAQDRFWLVAVRGVEGGVNKVLEELPPPLRRVDTAVLHQAVLPLALADASVPIDALVLDYTHDGQQAWGFAQEQGSVAILLRPIPLSLVRMVAQHGYRLPPKTTYFTPKVPSGLVMRQIMKVPK